MAARFITLNRVNLPGIHGVATVPVHINSDHIVAYWKFDEGITAVVVTKMEEPALFVTQTVEELAALISTI
jgi:hypothetical protein